MYKYIEMYDEAANASVGRMWRNTNWSSSLRKAEVKMEYGCGWVEEGVGFECDANWASQPETIRRE